MKHLNILVYGAGAIGIYFGSKIFKTGANVTIVEKPERIELIQSNKMRVISQIEGDSDFEPDIVDSILGLPTQDIILVCVKSYDTYDIAINLLPILQPNSVILSLQNGLENEKILSDILGDGLVIGAVPHFQGFLTNPHTVRQTAESQIVFGELHNNPTSREIWLSEVFSHADINHVISHQIQRDIWIRHIWNTSYNSISTITRSRLKNIHDDPDVMVIIESIMKEQQQVAKAEGISIEDRDIEDMLDSYPASAENQPNLFQDIESGRKLEIEPLMKSLMEKASYHGVDVPTTRYTNDLIRLLVKSNK